MLRAAETVVGVQDMPSRSHEATLLETRFFDMVVMLLYRNPRAPWLYLPGMRGPPRRCVTSDKAAMGAGSPPSAVNHDFRCQARAVPSAVWFRLYSQLSSMRADLPCEALHMQAGIVPVSGWPRQKARAHGK